MARLKIDMHVHTDYSDSAATVEEVIEAANAKGLDGIAITDHDTLEGVEEAMNIQHDLTVIPGEEVETDGGDILAIGIRELTPEGLSIEEAIHRVHAQNGLVFIPHPTIPFFGKLKESEIRKLPIDGLEVFSSIPPLAGHYASKNLAMAKRLGISVIAGSDSHRRETVGDAYTIIEAHDSSLPSILEALKLGRTEMHCRSSKLRFKMTALGHAVNIFSRRK